MRSGGEGGIRTHEGFHPAGFQDRCRQPLGYLSAQWNQALRAYLGTGLASNSGAYQANPEIGPETLKEPLAPDFTDARRFVQMSKAKYSEIRKKQPGGRHVWGVLLMEGRKQKFQTVGEGEGARRKARKLAQRLNQIEEVESNPDHRFLSWHRSGEPLPLDRAIGDHARAARHTLCRLHGRAVRTIRRACRRSPRRHRPATFVERRHRQAGSGRMRGRSGESSDPQRVRAPEGHGPSDTRSSARIAIRQVP